MVSSSSNITSVTTVQLMRVYYNKTPSKKCGSKKSLITSDRLIQVKKFHSQKTLLHSFSSLDAKLRLPLPFKDIIVVNDECRFF